MASAAKTADVTDLPVPPPVATKKGGSIVMPIIAVVFATAAGAGTSWFMTQQALAKLQPPTAEAEAAKPVVPKSPANYVALEPAFVVNLDDERLQRFLQVQIEVMTRDPKVVEQLTRHTPRIRSQLLLLLGQQHASDLTGRAGKEQLQAAVLEEVRNILRAETGSAEVEAVYFTSFVMQ